MRTLLLAAATAAALIGAPAAARAQGEPFRDPALPLSARIDDLMGRLTVDEKISLLHQYEPAIPRLGIGVFKAGTEALHGVAWSNDYNHNGDVVPAHATTFPQAVGLASTWDRALLRDVGSAVGDEARGLHAENPTVWGLNLWAPVVNLLRDPRWGRNEEGYSEDPTLTSSMATAYGSGMEGPDLDHLKAAPTLKHFLAYNNEVGRDVNSSEVPPRVLHEYDEQAFKPELEAGAATGVMASYNLLNGRPMTVSPLLNEIRAWSPRTLFNVSDAFAPYNLTGSQHYFATQPEADAAMFRAGIDGYVADNNDPGPMIAAVKQALAAGYMTMADVERADRDALSIRFRLGEFDPGGGPYGSIGPSAVNAPAHQQLSRRAADEAAVLLKNDGHALPLDASRVQRVAVVGPLSQTVYSDWYGGTPPYVVTPADGIRERVPVSTSEGVDRIALADVTTGRYVTSTAGAVSATAASADDAAQFDVFDWGQGIVTLRNVATGKVMGYAGGHFVTQDAQPNGWYVQQQFKLEPQPDGTDVLRYAGYETTESWFGKNVYVTIGPDGRLGLGAATPDAAAHFARTTLRSGIADAVAAAKGADAAVVVVGSMPFINGREAHDRTSMALSDAQARLVDAVRAANPRTIMVLETSYPDTGLPSAPAILWTTHAGQETGHALADVLFGDYDPAGRLTQTWYQSEADLPSILDYDVIGSHETYQYFRGRPLYAFGHGLSYTTFRYGGVWLQSRSVGPRDVVRAYVRVTNTGQRAGDEVVQLYTRRRDSRVAQPLKTLRAFARVHLRPGETRIVSLSFKASDLAIWDVTRDRWALERGTVDVMAGGASDELPARTALFVRGETIPPRDLSRDTQAQDYDGQQGTTLTDETKADGTAVAAGAGGAWLRFADSDLRRPGQIVARVSAAAAGALVVRLDDPVHGRVIGTLPVPATGDRYSWTTVAAPLSPVSGLHDVYLTFTAPLSLSRFRLG